MAGTSGADEEVTTNVSLTLLSSPLRRAVLLSIYDSEADDADGLPVEDVMTGPVPERVQVALYHNHLPKLEEFGIVRWDRRAETVAEGAAFGRIRPFIECLERNRERLPDDWRPEPGR
ncbi:DUF7344 domain-containing protein [Halorubrum sp. DTA46]|uniref:DUF7344 domain-containing protein n=1 Tax=Halorubrum sp. DTA46 TaxID=3402162 RepID=UPI003AAAC247